jgi:hypothetical protein
MTSATSLLSVPATVDGAAPSAMVRFEVIVVGPDTVGVDAVTWRPP